MALPAILSKVKALAPVAVVGGAIAITIKLLTQESTPNSQILKVDAEEDIKATEFEEQLEEEQPEEEEASPEEPKTEHSENTEDTTEEGQEESEGHSSDANAEQEPEEKEKSKQEEDEKEKPKLTFKDGGLGDILKEIFKSD